MSRQCFGIISFIIIVIFGIIYYISVDWNKLNLQNEICQDRCKKIETLCELETISIVTDPNPNVLNPKREYYYYMYNEYNKNQVYRIESPHSYKQYLHNDISKYLCFIDNDKLSIDSKCECKELENAYQIFNIFFILAFVAPPFILFYR